MSRSFILIATVTTLCLFVYLLNRGQEPTTADTLALDSGVPARQPDSLPMESVKRITKTPGTQPITFPANIAPLYQTTVYGKVSGYLKWIGVDKGDTVKKGQLIAIIDAPELDAQYKAARASSALKKITRQRLAAARRENPDFVAQQDVDMAGAVEKASAHTVQTAKKFRDYRRLHAPYDGVVTARYVDPGALIQESMESVDGSMPIVTIMHLETVRVYTSVPQEEMRYVREGTPVKVAVPGINTAIGATVTRTAVAVDPTTRAMLTEIDVPNPNYTLLPGMLAEVSFLIE